MSSSTPPIGAAASNGGAAPEGINDPMGINFNFNTSGNVVPVCDMIAGGYVGSHSAGWMTSQNITATSDGTTISVGDPYYAGSTAALVAKTDYVYAAAVQRNGLETAHDGSTFRATIHVKLNAATFGVSNTCNFQVPMTIEVDGDGNSSVKNSVIIKKYNGHGTLKPAILVDFLGETVKFW